MVAMNLYNWVYIFYVFTPTKINPGEIVQVVLSLFLVHSLNAYVYTIHFTKTLKESNKRSNRTQSFLVSHFHAIKFK